MFVVCFYFCTPDLDRSYQSVHTGTETFLKPQQKPTFSSQMTRKRTAQQDRNNFQLQLNITEKGQQDQVGIQTSTLRLVNSLHFPPENAEQIIAPWHPDVQWRPSGGPDCHPLLQPINNRTKYKVLSTPIKRDNQST